MCFENKNSGRKTKSLASSKRIPQLFSSIVSSYVIVFHDGALQKFNYIPNMQKYYLSQESKPTNRDTYTLPSKLPWNDNFNQTQSAKKH